MTIRSPFIVHQDFITSEECDLIAKQTRREILMVDQKLQKLERMDEDAEDYLFPAFKKLIPQFESHYTGFKYKGTEHLVFQQFPMNGKLAEEPHCENAVFKRKKWVRIRERDLTAILWLKDYQEVPPFDIKTQVLGGKLEFPVYNFGFQPQKGTLVVYPANERFISLTTQILVGELHCVRFHVIGQGNWQYDPNQYQGDFRSWFSDVV
jgi:hypothetical protein